VDGSEVEEFDDVIAFDLRNDGAYFVQFFTNSQGLADEVAVTYWNGSGTREWQSLTPAEDCDWSSAALDTRPDGRAVALSMGEHCPGGSQWRLFSFTQDGDPTEHVYMPSGGAFLPANYINQVHYLEDGEHVLAIYPQGRAGNIGNLVMVELSANTVTLVTPEVTVDSFPNGRSYHVQFSPDGRQLAYASSTANNEHFLHVLALDGGFEPLTITAGPRGDVVSAFFWRSDGGLVYVAGSPSGGDNSMFLLPSGGMEGERITRGNFIGNAGLATRDAILAIDYVEPDDDYRDPAADLVLVDFDGFKTTLIDGREANAWGYPLYWR
jgi:hypothetical protein